MSPFEKASRLKLRFETAKGGSLSTEDLWDLSLNMLDTIAVTVAKKLKEADSTVSYLAPLKSTNEELQLKFDLAKYILDVRVSERDLARSASEKSAKKQQLLEVLSRKQNAELEGKSVDELTAMINSL